MDNANFKIYKRPKDDDSDDELGVFKKLDDALKLYYENVGRTDYVNNDGIGKFLQFATDNGLEEDDIDDELGEFVDAADCIYIDFDDDFPFESNFDDENKRKEAMFKILQNCYKFGSA
eukprot:499948_1